MQKAKDVPFHEMLVKLMANLFDLYMVTGHGKWKPEVASNARRNFLLIYASLRNESLANGRDLWVIKPKFHLFQELFEYQGAFLGNPRNFWCYKDESFVGFLATIAHPRGGKHTAASVPLATLQKYRALAQ